MTEHPTLDSLEALTLAVRQFAQDRDWDQFHTARNLVLALVGEVGELAEQLQWTPDDQVAEALRDPGRHRAVADEIADVLIYLTRLADVLDVDLAVAAQEKLAENAGRYPRDEVRGSSAKRSRG